MADGLAPPGMGVLIVWRVFEFGTEDGSSEAFDRFREIADD